MPYRPSRPWARPPLSPQPVPPAWRPPMPMEVLHYPQGLPPGQRFLPSSVIKPKDAALLAHLYGWGRTWVPDSQPTLPLYGDASYEEAWEDNWPEATHTVHPGSFNRAAAFMFDERDEEILEALGWSPGQIDALAEAESVAFGDEAAKQRIGPKLAQGIANLFRRDASGQSKVDKTAKKLEDLSTRMAKLKSQLEQAGAPVPLPPPPAPPLPAPVPSAGICPWRAASAAAVALGLGYVLGRRR